MSPVFVAMRSCRTLVFGTANGWFLKMSTKVHIDQIIIALAQNCHKLERLEIQWDPDTIRFSENSSKFIDSMRSVGDTSSPCVRQCHVSVDSHEVNKAF